MLDLSKTADPSTPLGLTADDFRKIARVAPALGEQFNAMASQYATMASQCNEMADMFVAAANLINEAAESEAE